MKHKIAAIFTIFALFAAAANADEKPRLAKPISLDGVKFEGGFRGKATKPKTATNDEELAELVGEAAAKTLGARIDFEKYDLVLFRWAGSGADNLTLKIVDEKVVFQYQRGLTRDLRQHQDAFAVMKKADWNVKTVPFRFQPDQPKR